MKLALHRSLIFWCGLLTISFLCWAWWDSFSRYTRITMGDHSIKSMAGGITIDGLQLGMPFAFERADSSVSRARRITDPFPAPHFLTSSDARSQWALSGMWDGSGSIYQPADLRQLSIYVLAMRPDGHWILLIPYWLILLAVAMLWLALLVWRARRRKRLPTADS